MGIRKEVLAYYEKDLRESLDRKMIKARLDELIDKNPYTFNLNQMREIDELLDRMNQESDRLKKFYGISKEVIGDFSDLILELQDLKNKI